MTEWSTPETVRAKLLRRWRRGDALTSAARGDEFIAADIALRGPTPTELGSRYDEVQRWVHEWQRVSAPYRLTTKIVGARSAGANEIPGRLHLDTFDDLTRFLGTTAEARRHRELVASAGATVPALADWVIDKPFTALAHEARFDRLLACIQWVAGNASRTKYLREIDAVGIDTKFIESNRAILIELVDAAEAARVLDPETRDIARRYGFRAKPSRVRIRLLDTATRWIPAGISDIEVLIGELAANRLDVERVFVIENEVTCLAFPPVPHSLLIFGGGYAVSRIAPLRWLDNVDLVYWGDIDTHGFRILDRLRATFPHARSILMDRDTLLAHESVWETEDSPVNAHLAHLTEAEAALYRDLVEDTLGESVRLEQERIAYRMIETALAAATRAPQRD